MRHLGDQPICASFRNGYVLNYRKIMNKEAYIVTSSKESNFVALMYYQS